ncbi:MAG: hypothetical protein PVF68_07575 [Acidobacteriota bacterium]|jgi:hypothetical protein
MGGRRAVCYNRRPMPGSTLLIVGGSWLLLLALTALAYRFNRGRGED